MKVDVSQHSRYLEFVEQSLGLTFNGITSKTVALVEDGGEIVLVYVYSHFTPENCNITVVNRAPQVCSKRALAVMFGYPFLQLGLRRVTAVVQESNLRSLESCRRVGFTHEGKLRHWFGAEDGIILGMLREECKWI